MLKIPCARDNMGRLRFPSTCSKDGGPFSCYGCDMPLIVHKGSRRVHHFQHATATRVSCAGGGETMLHKSTKEWVARHVESTAFTILSQCPDCKCSHPVFAGQPGLNAVVECRTTVLGRVYQIDVSVFCGSQSFADIEVVYSHSCGQRKRCDLALSSRLGCIEVSAINLAMREFPMALQTCGRQIRCRKCAIIAVGKRRATAAAATIAAWVCRVVPAWRRRKLLGETAVCAAVAQWKFVTLQAKLLHRDKAARDLLASEPYCGIVEAPAGSGKTSTILAMAKNCTRALLVTFNKDLSDATNARAGLNLIVKTFDSVCHSFTGIGGGMTDQDIVRAAYPKCIPWFKKKGASGISAVASAVLQNCTVEPCDQHTAVMYGIQKGSRLDSFARSRSIVENRKIDIAAGYDHLFVDEYQDMTPQALRIIANSTTPTTLVGDSNQKIYAFLNQLDCECEITHPEQAARDQAVVALHQTFRSPLSIVRYMCSIGIQCTAPPMTRRGGWLQCPASALSLVCIQASTCVVARSNERVYAVARQLANTGFRVTVIGGKKIAGELERCNTRGKSPLQRWAATLTPPDRKDAIAFLKAHDGPFGGGSLTVCTVHRAKGTEHRHVVLVDEIDRTEEPEVWYVAHTRHSRTLIQLL